MKEDIRIMWKPYAILFGMGLTIALVARVGLAAAAGLGVLSFDYISASGVGIFDVVCSILTGSTLLGFMCAAGLALVVSTAGAALYGLLFAQGRIKASPGTAFLAGWGTALVALVLLVVVVLGLLSAVQVGSMSSKLPGTLVLAIAVVAFAAFLGTLIAAAAMVVCACVARARGKAAGSVGGYVGKLGVQLIAAVALCGVVVTAMTVGTLSALLAPSVNAIALLGWFAADIAVNLVILVIAHRMVK